MAQLEDLLDARARELLSVDGQVGAPRAHEDKGATAMAVWPCTLLYCSMTSRCTRVLEVAHQLRREAVHVLQHRRGRLVVRLEQDDEKLPITRGTSTCTGWRRQCRMLSRMRLRRAIRASTMQYAVHDEERDAEVHERAPL